MMTYTHSYFLALFFPPPMLIALWNPRANSGSAARWWWDRGYRKKRNTWKVLPLTLMSMPGSARIWSTVSTWFLLQALWRRVSPSTKMHATKKHPKERRGGREERNPKLGCAWCLSLFPSPHDIHTNKMELKYPHTHYEKKKILT